MITSDLVYDVIIVGAGPTGLSAALNAHKSKLNYLLLEKSDHIADTQFCYQKGKFVMAEPTLIPLRGALWLSPATREVMLSQWDNMVRTEGLNVMFNAAVTGITQQDALFHAKTETQVFKSNKVIIAMGTQGNPRPLGVPGQDLPHVLPRLTDPALYLDQDIVVIGGGDAAIEIAISLSEKNRVSLVVRTSEFLRVKGSLERQVLEKANKKELTIYYNSAVERIDAESVTLKLPDKLVSVLAQCVIVKIGTIPPRSFLEKCGITFPSQAREAIPLVSASYETNLPGLFLIGAVGGRDLIKHGINQGYEVVESICGRVVLPADEELLRERVNFLTGTVSERIRQIVSNLPIMSSATEEQVRELLLSSEFHQVSKGQVVFSQHDYSESFYMILKGHVNASIKPDDGPEKMVATIGPGAFFGEMSLVSGRRRSATIRAGEDGGVLWEVARKAMLKFLYTTPAANKVIDETFLIRAFQAYLFPNLDQAILAQLAKQAKILKFEKGAVIIKEGDEGDAFYLLRSGMVKVSKIKEGREWVMVYLSVGQHFGEMALLSGAVRGASVSAIDKVEVIQVLKEDFIQFIDSSQELKERLQAEVVRRQSQNIGMALQSEHGELTQFMASQEVVVGDNVLVIDEHRCVDCDYCVKACESVHEDGQARIKRVGIRFANLLVANSCRHCENPLCMTDCPPGDAIMRDPRGEVYIRSNCIGCGNCAANCPYDNIFMVHPEETPSVWERWTGVLFPKKPENHEEGVGKALAIKCDLCRGIKGGPACVRSCPTGAILRLKPDEYFERMRSIVFKE